VYSDAPAVKVARKSIQHRIVAVATVLLVPGIFIATSIPASAFSTGEVDASASVSDADPQSLIVDTALDGTAFSRDGFDATTTKELAAKKQAQLYANQTSSSASASSGDYSKVTPRAAGDDYPYRSGGGLSPMGYVIRQCTDFVAWRLNRDSGHTKDYKYVWSMMTPGGGSASQWASAWKANGWKTSHTPVKGAVAWFSGNHVAYVKSVDGDKVNLEEYNWGGDASYHTRTIDASEVALFLYPPP
jgi:surface antigen